MGDTAGHALHSLGGPPLHSAHEPSHATQDEVAAGGNYDNEGRNGGWVLELLTECSSSAAALPIHGPIARAVVLPDEADGAINCRYHLSNSFRYHSNTRYFFGGIDRLVD